MRVCVCVITTLLLQNLDDYEYNPDDHEDSEDEGWEARTGSRTSRKRSALLVAGTPLTFDEYQNTLKEKINQLYGHAPADMGEGSPNSEAWQPRFEDWVRVQDRCVCVCVCVCV